MHTHIYIYMYITNSDLRMPLVKHGWGIPEVKRGLNYWT